MVREIEEDPEMRQNVNLYIDKNALQRRERRVAERDARRQAAEAAGEATTMDGAAGDDDSADSDIEDGFPEVQLTELLEELSLNGSVAGDIPHQEDFGGFDE